MILNLRNFAKSRSDLDQNEKSEWKLGKFKHTKLTDSTKNDLVLILCFNSLVKGQYDCKYSAKNLDKFKDSVLQLFKENTSKLKLQLTHLKFQQNKDLN